MEGKQNNSILRLNTVTVCAKRNVANVANCKKHEQTNDENTIWRLTEEGKSRCQIAIQSIEIPTDYIRITINEKRTKRSSQRINIDAVERWCSTCKHVDSMWSCTVHNNSILVLKKRLVQINCWPPAGLAEPRQFPLAFFSTVFWTDWRNLNTFSISNVCSWPGMLDFSDKRPGYKFTQGQTYTVCINLWTNWILLSRLLLMSISDMKLGRSPICSSFRKCYFVRLCIKEMHFLSFFFSPSRSACEPISFFSAPSNSLLIEAGQRGGRSASL